MKRFVLMFVLTGMLWACQDSDLTRPADSPLFDIPAPSAAIVEEGNGHFFFLSPISDGGENGIFNPDLLTRVEICEWSQADAVCIDDPVAAFESDDIEVHLAGEDGPEPHYHVNWKVGKTEGLERDVVYAIRVVASETELGFAEVVVGRNAGDARRLGQQNDALGVPRNRTLPITYRIEFGLFCEGSCVEFTVTDETGGTFTNQEETAGTSIPPDALPEGVEEVTLIIEEIQLGPQEDCLSGLTVITTTGKCIRFDTEPKLVNGFDDAVVVGICFDDGNVPPGVDPENFLIHRFDPDDPNATVEELPGALAPFLDCSDAVASIDGGPIKRLAFAGLRLVNRLVGPRPLNAADEGFGGVTGAFSNFQWALPVTLSAVSTPTQQALILHPVGTDPVVQVLTSHNHPDAPQVSVPGQDVTFEFFGPGGISLGSITVLSDADGLATVPWTMTADLGVHTVEATVLNSLPVIFEATAVGGAGN